ncbi:hypothetical protein Q8F55_006499 [Vanrija albida]|uniref:TPR-like protein n=1 Tax=Vanrija albida TaxID=181172 RepID=A0ABR3PXP2_9TREE
MSAQHSPKAAHYRASLGAALVRGAWADANPGTEPNGNPLSWAELIRKWAKHTAGNPNVVHAIRNVSLLELSSAHHVAVPSPAHLASSASSGDGLETVGSGSASSYIHVSHPSHAPGGRSSFETAPAPIASTASASATATPGSIGGAVSRSRGAAHDGEDGTSAGAWAVGASWGRALDSSKGEEVRESLRALQSATLSRDESISSALAIAYQHHALGEFDLALAAYERFDWSSDPLVGVVPGDAAVTERIRARTLQGMAYELGSRPDAASALEAYLAAAALIDKLSASPLAYPSYLAPANTARSTTAPFESQREVLRHVSTALARATVITGRGTDSASTLRILRTYNALASNWAPSFRVNQRQRMLSLYLSALQSSYPVTGAPPVERYLLNGGAPSRQPRATWRAEVADALAAGQKSLSDSTTFPRAGEINYPVVSFANQAAAYATISPPLTREVINSLWWATTVTFQSQAILRHLTRLQVAAGDAKDARRTFELYVSLVLKARQARYPESALELALNPDDAAAEEVSKNGLERDSDTEPEEHVHGDLDSDSDFVSALLVGSRLLLLELDEPSEAWRYISLAGDVVRMHDVPPNLTAAVEEAKGIIRMSMATNVATRKQRPLFQVQALSHLRAAVTLDPSSSSAFFHLAYGHAIAREIAPATEAIRTALELDPHNVRGWHLLTLLLTAANNWKGAEKAGETGVALWESDDTTDELDSDSEANNPRPLLLSSGENSVPSSPPAVRVDKAQRLEAVIQLRMTLNVIAEKLYGPDVALERQTQLFSFFSQRSEAERSGNTTRKRSDTFSTRVTDRPASGRASDGSIAPYDLGGSYVFTPITDVQVSPPSPTQSVSKATSTASGVASTTGTVTGPGTSTTSTARKPNAYSELSADDGKRLGPRRAMLSHRKSLLNKHLHVPSVVRSGNGRSDGRSDGRSETLRTASTQSLPLQSQHRARTPSASTVALSIAPTAVHSHFRGARSIAPPPPPPAKNAAPRSPTEAKILSDLWLMSAASFRRAGKPEQALVAIEEAETIAPDNPAVWVQLGMFHQACGHVDQDGKPSQALAAFTKSLLLRPDHPPAVVLLARLYLGQGDVDLAHSLLSQLTQDRGWDVAEAWYTLGTVCEKQGRASASRESLLYALELERSRTCRALPDALPAWV